MRMLCLIITLLLVLGDKVMSRTESCYNVGNGDFDGQLFEMFGISPFFFWSSRDVVCSRFVKYILDLHLLTRTDTLVRKQDKSFYQLVSFVNGGDVYMWFPRVFVICEAVRFGYDRLGMIRLMVCNTICNDQTSTYNRIVQIWAQSLSTSVLPANRSN